MSESTIWAVVPAAGIGERMLANKPKQYLSLCGKTILERTIQSLLSVKRVERVIVVVAANDTYWATLACSQQEKITRVLGGASRALSVTAGVSYVADNAPNGSYALVHDAARPLTSIDDINRLIDAVFSSGNPDNGGLLAVPVQDTLKLANTNHTVERTVNREKLWQAQTPQLFRAALLLDALQQGDAATVENRVTVITDEASAMELAGVQPLLVESLQANFKITRAQDLALAQAWLNSKESAE